MQVAGRSAREVKNGGEGVCAAATPHLELPLLRLAYIPYAWQLHIYTMGRDYTERALSYSDF